MTDFCDLPPICCVLFGAPGTGKTTTLGLLGAPRDAKESRFFFATIEEPTNQPEIAKLLKQMYEETPVDIATRGSIAFVVQCEILKARIKTFQDFTEQRLTAAHAEAHRRGQRLVVVVDGHPNTDALLYVAAKVAGGLISSAQWRVYVSMKGMLLTSVEDLFGAPEFYCQIKISNDATGEEHHKRVCVQRNNAAEEGVDPAVFAALAQFADNAKTFLTSTLPADNTMCEVESSGHTPEEVRLAVVAELERFCDEVEFITMPPLKQ